MAGIRLPEVKEEGRCFFGPEDMEGVGYPPSLARTAMPTFHAPRKTRSIMEPLTYARPTHLRLPDQDSSTLSSALV